MCEFISWIEKNGKVYFLTSEDLASKRGKQLIKHVSRKEDLVGHGAIRWFYGEFKGGTEKECTDFSTPNNFPIEIVKAIKAGKFRGMGVCLGVLTYSAYTEYERIQQSALAECEKIEQSADAEYERIRYSAYAEYEKIEQSADAEYKKIEQSARAEYERIKQSARAEYQKIEQSAYAEYRKIEQSAGAEYKKIRQSAYAEYKKIAKSAFWNLFADPNNRKEWWR